MPLYIAKSGDLEGCHACLTHWLTDWLTTLKDSATQLLIKFKSGALVTQLHHHRYHQDHHCLGHPPPPQSNAVSIILTLKGGSLTWTRTHLRSSWFVFFKDHLLLLVLFPVDRIIAPISITTHQSRSGAMVWGNLQFSILTFSRPGK